jgi:outer membrane autotransporter protein
MVLSRQLSRGWRHALLAGTVLAGAGLVFSGAALACTVSPCTVTSEAELRNAITFANGNPNTVINLQANVTLSADLPALQATGMTFNGGGNTLSGGGEHRGLFVYSGTASIENLTITGTQAKGGDGQLPGGLFAGSGGGAGLGGALFVNAGAAVAVSNVSFNANSAIGGNGGAGSPPGRINGGAGGGGLGGDGNQGGGGVGSGAIGGGNAGAGIVIGQAGGGTVGSEGGAANGGGGGRGGSTPNGGAGGGVGGGGADGVGREGGFGGGGGGGARGSTDGGPGGFGGGGGSGGGGNATIGNASGGFGGAGGFGGGGGSGGQEVTGGTPGGGGAGGFGGGAGSAAGLAGSGGGGGAGMGGAIFVVEGGSLTVKGNLIVNGNSVAGGTAGGSDAGAGSAFGSGIFLQGNNGTLTFATDAGNTQTLSDVIADQTGSGGAPDTLYATGGPTCTDGCAGYSAAGSWRLAKTGAGTLVLTGNNTFSGGVTINGGTIRVGHDNALGTGTFTVLGSTLDIQDGITISNDTDLQANLDINVDANETGTHAGAISSTGAFGVNKTGGGTLVLSGTNTYTGGTVITGGVLQVGADSNLGAVTGGIEIGDATLRASAGFTSGRAVALTGDATIEIETGDLVLNGNITGSGSLTKTGADTLRLFGANGYLGGTTIADGTLLGDTDSLQGDILNEAKLIFDQSFAGTYSGKLTSDGTGILSKEGTGAVILTGDSAAYDGETYVNAGTLRVNNKLGGAIYVASGATLGGNGTIGKTTIAAGGIHAPGNSIDTQTVDGDYVNAGILEIEATPTQADKIIVNGAVDITGATLNLVLTPTTAASWGVLTGPYVIIENDLADAVTGTFTLNDTNNLVFLDKRIDYAGGDGNDVTLELERNNVEFTDVARTRNQLATAGAIDTLDNTSAVWTALAMTGSDEEARALLEQLSGEAHASLIGMFQQDSRFWRNAANDRLRSAFGSVAAAGQQVMGFGATGLTNAPADTQGLALWTRGFGSWARTDSDGNAADFTRNTGGMLGGADMAVSAAARLGVLAGYAHSSFDADDRNSSGDADSFQIGLYGGTQIDAFGVRAGVAYAWHDVDTERQALGDKLTADYDADTVQVFGEAGYAFDLDAVRLEPFANAAYVSTHTDSFAEDGGPAALKSDSEATDNTFTTLGLRAATGFELGAMPASLRAMAGWRHAFGDMQPEATLAFDGSADFVIAGAPIARDAAVLEAGFDLAISSDATFGITYSGEIGDDAEDHGLNGTLAVEF